MRNTGLEEIIVNHGNIIKLTFEHNDVLFNENERARGIYYINSGSVKIYKTISADQIKILDLVTTGEILGLHDVIDKHYYTRSANAITKTEAGFITAEDFTDLINSNNTFKLLAMKVMCTRITKLYDHIVKLNEQFSEERFADTLLMLVHKFGVNEKNELNIHLTIEDLAGFTSTSKIYLKKIISALQDQGMIAFEKDTIGILNLPALEHMTELSSQTS